jgi:hypothetical protein
MEDKDYDFTFHCFVIVRITVNTIRLVHSRIMYLIYFMYPLSLNQDRLDFLLINNNTDNSPFKKVKI